MFGKKFLFASLAMVAAVSPLNADSVTYVADGKKVVAQGDVTSENNEKVVVKSSDGKETVLKADSVLSLNRDGFAEPLLLALRESLLALKDSSKINKAAGELSKISTDKNFKPWEREYALRYKFDMFYSLGLVEKTKSALQELAGQFPKSRVLVDYRKKLAYFAVAYKNNPIAFSQKKALNDDLGGGLGAYIGTYIDAIAKVKKGNYKDAQRSLKNLLQSQLPKLKKGDKPLSNVALDLKKHVLGYYAYCMAKQGNIDGAKGQLEALKEYVGQSNDRTAALYNMAQAAIYFHEKKYRKAYYLFLKVSVQYPNEIDLQLSAHLSAIEAAKTAKGMESSAKKLEAKLKVIHPNYK